jgi:hypothetical protein
MKANVGVHPVTGLGTGSSLPNRSPIRGPGVAARARLGGQVAMPCAQVQEADCKSAIVGSIPTGASAVFIGETTPR